MAKGEAPELDRQRVRLECLKIAAENRRALDLAANRFGVGSATKATLELAETYFKWVTSE